MPRVDTNDLLRHARRHGYAIAAFEVGNLPSLKAATEAAESSQAPVILSVTEGRYEPRDFSVFMAALEHAADNCSAPIAVQAQIRNLESAVRAINLGCTSIKVEGTSGDPDAHQALTRSVVEMAHGCGVAVEGPPIRIVLDTHELKNATARHCLEATFGVVKDYVAQTGIDCCAVVLAIPNPATSAHLDTTGLERLNATAAMPLALALPGVLSQAQCAALIQHGIAKIDFGDSCSQLEHKLGLLGSAGRTTDILKECQSWRPVQHVIVYNASGTSDARLAAIMAQGEHVLRAIPGVRHVFAGWAVAEAAQYRCCWLVEFVHAKVIASYRQHPDHVAFADNYFRPIAQDRMSIDFAANGTRLASPAIPPSSFGIR